MPFTSESGRAAGKIGGKASVQARRDLFDLVAGEHKDSYNGLLERLRDGEKLEESQIQFMDRVEKLFPYKYAKAGLIPNQPPNQFNYEQHLHLYGSSDVQKSSGVGKKQLSSLPQELPEDQNEGVGYPSLLAEPSATDFWGKIKRASQRE